MSAKVAKTKKNKTSSTNAELVELKKRIAELEHENQELLNKTKMTKKNSSKKVAYKKIFRSFGVTFFISLSIVTFMLFNVSSWVKATILDTDTFVATTQPLLEQPAVQETLKTEISNAIFDKVDIEAELQKVLPEDVAFLAAPLSGQIESFTTDKIGEILSSEQLNMVWSTTLESVQSTLISYLQDENTDGVISVNDVYDYASTELQDTSIAFLLNKQLPDSVGQITLAELPWVDEAKQYINAIDRLPIVFVLVSAFSFALAIILAANKKKVFIVLLALNVIMMLATLGALQVGKIATGDSVDTSYSAAAVEIYQVLSSPLISRTQGYLALFSATLLIFFATSKLTLMVKTRSLGAKYSSLVVNKITPEFDVPSWLDWVITDRTKLLWASFIISFLLFGVRIPPDYSQVLTSLIVSTIITFVLYIFSLVLMSTSKYQH